MWLVIRLLVCAALLWQVVVGLGPLCSQARAGLQVPVSMRAFASTQQRLDRALGADAALFRAVHKVAPRGMVLATQAILGEVADYKPEEIMMLARKNGVIDQLTVQLYPDPWIVKAPDAVAFVMQQVRAKASTALFWMPGDPRPSGIGWQLLHAAKEFELWTFQTD